MIQIPSWDAAVQDSTDCSASLQEVGDTASNSPVSCDRRCGCLDAIQIMGTVLEGRYEEGSLSMTVDVSYCPALCCLQVSLR
jgi:hypothetical protein